MNAIDILRSKGLKKTAQRIMVISILQKSGISLTEADIKVDMGDLYDRITFYRTVQTLLEANIIHRITVDNITVKYALNDLHDHNRPGNHVHFFCRVCHSVTCLHDVPELTYKLEKGFKAEEYEVLIKGICNTCRLSKL